MKPLVAVLAGGASSRMGTDKAQVTIGSEPMLARVARAGTAVGDVVVVGGAGEAGVERIPDLRPGPLGPLSGLETALVHADGRDVVLVGVDQPFVSGETLERLIDLGGDVVVPIDEDWAQVTCAVYRQAFLPAVQATLDAGRDLAIHHILDRVDTTRVGRELWETWGEDGRSWYSVDTPEALAAGIERFEEGA
jgi:molybdopterin-guanine dinucleotide biosynthesis protein A